MQGVPKTADADWQERMRKLLFAISTIQASKHTVSLRELEAFCGVCRQTIANWLVRAEQLGYVDRHAGLPRAVQILPLGERTLHKLTLKAIKDTRKKVKAADEHADVAASV